MNNVIVNIPQQKISVELHPKASALRRLVVGYRVSQCLFVAAKLGIADLLKDGAKSIEYIAQATGAHASSLYRIMRLLASEGVFEEEQAHFKLTPLAIPLQKDTPGSLRIRAIFEGEECNWRAWGNIMHSVSTGAPAFDDVFKMGFFDYVKEDDVAASIFDELMATQTMPWAHAVAGAYDFSGVKTLVDVAGGYGALLTTIMAMNPSVQGILFDLKHVIKSAALKLADMPGISDRCQAIAGDIFDSVPKGGDCYMLKYILHDWDDERSKIILRNCRSAMPKNGGRLLIIELLIPSGNEYNFGKSVDVDMLVLTGGRERTEEEHRSILEASGFKLSRVIPTKSDLSILEAVPV